MEPNKILAEILGPDVVLDSEIVEKNEKYILFKISSTIFSDEYCYAYYIPELEEFGVEDTLEEATESVKQDLKIKILSPDDIYNASVLRETYDLSTLLNSWHCHLPELVQDCDLIDWADIQSLVKVKIHMDEYIDGERIQVLGSLWFKNEPVMIFRHAGRNGSDEVDRFITDKERFWYMVDYLRPFCRNDLVIYETDKPCKELTKFYGSFISFE